MNLDIIVGARPNFMKVATIIESLNNVRVNDNIKFRLIHTGQHFDNKMSGSFFEDLNIPMPDYNFEAGGGSQSVQTSEIMIKYEQLLSNEPSDMCLVVGDVNSTMACSIVAKKNNILVAHVEAGIRSFDLRMPEEINRMVTDSISDYFFTTSISASNNLIRNGISEEKIFFVGNTMVDTLLRNRMKFKKPIVYDSNKLVKGQYYVLTLHRPSNVDNQYELEKLLKSILLNAGIYPIIFPIHPRTLKIFDKLKLYNKNLICCDPLGYLEFNYLVENSRAVITDSGGITEETTVLGIPCLTLRDNTERPETVNKGTNELVGTDEINIKKYMNLVNNGNWKSGSIPEKWDGHSGERIVKILNKIFTV